MAAEYLVPNVGFFVLDLEIMAHSPDNPTRHSGEGNQSNRKTKHHPMRTSSKFVHLRESLFCKAKPQEKSGNKESNKYNHERKKFRERQQRWRIIEGLLFVLLGCWKDQAFLQKPSYLLGFHVWNERTKGTFVCTMTPCFLFLKQFFTPVFQLHLVFTSSVFDRERHKGRQRHPSLSFYSAQLGVTWYNIPPPSSLPSPYSRTLQV